MKHLHLALFGSLLAAAGCASTVTSDANGAGGGPGSSTADGGTNADGGPATPDADDDDGPEWNGQMPMGTPQLLVEDATRYTLTRDDQIAFATKDGVKVMPATGGAITTIGTDSSVNLVAAGRAVFVHALTSNTITLYSKAGGTRAVPGVTLDMSSNPDVYDTPSGDFAFVHQPNGGHWFVDPVALTMTPITLPITGSYLICQPSGETLGCIEPNKESTQAVVFTVDKTGAHVLTTMNGSVTGAPVIVGGDAFYSDGSDVYRIAAGGTTPSVLVAGGSNVTMVQDGWLGVTVGTGDASEVRVLKTDGSQMKSVATGNGVQIEAFSLGDTLHDSARVRWLGICDSDGKGTSTNLRVYDPATSRTVSLSKSSCDLRAITYSDNFAFVIDNAHGIDDPILSEDGDPLVIDLRDGSSRGNPTGMSYFDHQAKAIGKSKLLFEWLSFGVFDQGCYFDGHSAPTTMGATFEEPLEQFGTYMVTSDVKGIVMPARAPDDQFDLYYVPFE